jgi:benzylsuccinate CoA-transferase BbsF subunit
VTNNRVLEGVKVLDFGWQIVGPLTSHVLAIFGAEVIKVETRTRVDHNRETPPYVEGTAWMGDRAALFPNFNACKYGITLNVHHTRGVELVKRLVAWADVLIENFTGGTMERLGLGYDELKKINSDIIMLSASAYGQTGSYAKTRATGTTLTAVSGITYLTGQPDGPPTQPAWVYSDTVIPRLAVFAILAALDYRDRTGKGQYLDMSQFEGMMHYITPVLLGYVVNGRELARIGNRSTYAAPHGIYRCKGEFRWCAITVFNDEEWKSLCQVIDKPALAEDPEFATLVGRLKKQDKLDRMIEEWTINHSPEEVMELLQGAGVAAGVVQNGEDLDKDPQLESRGYYCELDHPTLGKFSYSGMPVKLSKTPYEIRRSHCFAEHNEYVYTKLLGMSDKEFVQLLGEGAFE